MENNTNQRMERGIKTQSLQDGKLGCPPLSKDQRRFRLRAGTQGGGSVLDQEATEASDGPQLDDRRGSAAAQCPSLLAGSSVPLYLTCDTLSGLIVVVIILITWCPFLPEARISELPSGKASQTLPGRVPWGLALRSQCSPLCPAPPSAPSAAPTGILPTPACLHL